MRGKAEWFSGCLKSDLSAMESDLAVGESRMKGKKPGTGVGVTADLSTVHRKELRNPDLQDIHLTNLLKL